MRVGLLTRRQCSIDAHNNPLTDETLDAAKKADAIILGAVGGPVRIPFSLSPPTSHYVPANMCL